MLKLERVSATMTVLNALALGLIMCLHVPTLPKYWLFDLGVPWFFFASGFWYAEGLQRGQAYGMQVRKRVRTLLVPYFLWNLIWFPVLFACNWVGWRYCGAARVVDGSLPCIVRCLGLSPFAWPALVPTWFLRALFVAVVLVGAAERGVAPREGGVGRWAVAGAFWGVFLSRGWWMPDGAPWVGFFTFGVSLLGCACFATGVAVRGLLAPSADSPSQTRVVSAIRRQTMPVYILHAAVIVSVGWGMKSLNAYGPLETTAGDVVMWFVGIGGAVAIGEALRRFFPRVAGVLFGGR